MSSTQQQQKITTTTKTLSEEQILDHMLLVADFTSFWDGKIDFTAFSQEEAEHLLAEAAEIVVRVRGSLVGRGIEDHCLAGFSKEYLWSLQELPKEEEFVHALVHASFKDEGGYICDLTEAEVDELIAKAMCETEEEQKVQEAAKEGEVKNTDQLTLATLKKGLEEAVADISALESSSAWTSTLSKDLEGLNAHLSEFNRLVKTLQKRVAFRTDASEKLQLRVSGRLSSLRASGGPNVGAGEPETEEKLEEKPAVEEKPATEEKPEEKPAVEEKPAEQQEQPVEQKEEQAATGSEQTPAEEKPATEEKPEENPAVEEKPAEDECKKKGIIQVKMVVDDVNALEAEVEEFTSSAKDIERVFSFPEANEGLLLISNLKKKGRVYVEHLTKDILKLDSLPSEGIRAERKNAVIYIQQLIDNLENLQQKLELIEKEMSARSEQERILREEEEKAKKAEQEKQALAHKVQAEKENQEKLLELQQKRQQQLQEQAARQKQHDEFLLRRRQQQEDYERRIEEQRRKVREEEEKKERAKQEEEQRLGIVPVSNEALEDDEEIGDLLPLFKKLRLEVQFDSTQKSDGYYMTANIPGCEEKSIDVRVTPDKKLVITGCRLPTKQDLVMMNRMLDQRFNFISQRERINALLKMGASRYGTFEEIYRLPAGVITNKIEAQYLNGSLRIFLPVQQQQRIPVSRSSYSSPYGSGYPSDYGYAPRTRNPWGGAPVGYDGSRYWR